MQEETHQYLCLKWECYVCMMQIDSLYVTVMPCLYDQLAVSSTCVYVINSRTIPVFSTKSDYIILAVRTDYLKFMLGIW